MICKPKQSTVDQSGHITARTLTRVRVRVKTRVRYMGRVTALWPEFQSALLLQCKSKLSTVDQSGHITARTLTRVRVRVRV